MQEGLGKHIQQMESMLDELGRSGSEKIYAQLLKGEPLPVSHFAELLHVEVDAAQKIIATFGEMDDQGRVTGFLGLSVVPTQHKLIVKGKTLYTSCALEAAILPQFLLLEALIESEDPVSGHKIQLSVNEDFLDWTDPVPVFISWAEENHRSDKRQNFCQTSQFFASQKTAAEWLAENAGTSITNLEELFTYARGGRGCC